MTRITTDGLISEAEIRTGLVRTQLLIMVAKSAAVRHVATGPDRDNFILKGGTLLTHVYGSPRQSIADADYYHRERESVKAQDLEAALTIDRLDFQLRPTFRFDGLGSFEGKAEFSFEDIHLSTRRRDRELKITISVRPGEQLDPNRRPLNYVDPLLADRPKFEINGLTRNELAAEKLLGWVSKALPKHLVDLAYLGREHADYIDYDRVAELVRLKFAAEKGARRYREAGITRPGDLVRAFTDPVKLDRNLKRAWDTVLTEDLFFLPSEQAKSENETLLSAGNVERLALEFWQPTLEALK